MGQLLDIGDQAGKAAPGEFGPRALLTTAGRVLGTTDGVTPRAVYPPGYLLTQNTGATVSNPGAVATTVLSAGAITNLWPAGVAAGDAVHFLATGTLLWSSTQTAQFDLYFGAGILTSFAVPSYAAATARSWRAEILVPYTTIAGAGAGAMRPSGIFVVAGTGAGWQAISASSGIQVNDGASVTPAAATNAAANCDLKVTPSIGTATTTIVCNLFVARYFPKNY